MNMETMRNGLRHLGFTAGWAANEADGIVLWEHDSPTPTADAIEAAAREWESEQQAQAQAAVAATAAAIHHAKSLGFTDAMIAVMYPNLTAAS